MTRGRTSSNGDVRVAANGYHYTKVNGQWRLTHHIVMENELGRPLDLSERVVFIDKTNKLNLNPANLRLVKKASQTLARRKAELEFKISELQVQLEAINKEIESGSSSST